MYALGQLMPQGATIYEFLWGIFFAVCGSCCYQFIEAAAARKAAEQAHVPIKDRPEIDMVLVAYSMCGAPLSAIILISVVHASHGTMGFGELGYAKSAFGFSVAGPVGPKIVIKLVGYISGLISSRLGGNAKP